MARPSKTGIDYFPMDVDIDTDDKILLICAELGEIAFGRIVRLLLEIYKAGYFKVWNQTAELLFSSKKNIPLEDVQQLVAAAFRHALLDEDLYKQHGIVTSSGIQRRYILACKARQHIIIDRKFLLCDVDEFTDSIKSKIKLVNFEYNHVNSKKTQVFSDSIPKEKKSKVNKKSTVGVNSKNTRFLPLAELLAELIENNDSHYFNRRDRAKLIAKWSNDIRLLVEADGYPEADVKAVIYWCQKDDFWKTNILSAGKLREQFPRLRMQAEKAGALVRAGPKRTDVCSECGMSEGYHLLTCSRAKGNRAVAKGGPF